MKSSPRFLIAGLCILLAAACILPLVIPIPPESGTLPARQLADEDSQFIDVNGLEVHYKETGRGGPPAVLLHGFVSNVYTWHKVLGPLGENRRALAFDRTGFGLTARPMPPYAGDNPYTQTAHAQLTADLLDELDIEQAVLIGNSVGGAIALLTALAHPERVAALVLADAAVYVGTGAPSWTRPFLALPQVRRMGPLLARTLRDRAGSFLGAAWYDSSGVSPEVIPGYLAPFQVDDWDRALWEFTLASEDLDLASRLSELNIPVLVITGDSDMIVPSFLSERLAEDIPGAELVVIKNCGHVPQEECPEEFLAAVDEFLERVAPPG